MDQNRQVVSMLVDNHSGVLARVSSLFARKGFNIDSLTVSATNDEKISRITITTTGDKNTLHQILSQTGKLIEVQCVEAMDPDDSIQRELLLVKIKAGEKMRNVVTSVSDIFKANVVDLSVDSMVVELTGKPSKIDAFLTVINEYEVIEMCRTGVTTMARGSRVLEKI
ncbi:acetolactate synthase small subunit [Scatolibacter rhodanostii]|uniref:acetolactate synthase small subunit n=1 Tax=Scatolibacter rhodanostii TaxID=2014781 RepID=UPI000C06E5BC|nr:acetolactate synthase small subunit [Scatolibacter rhodanostii]